MWVIHSQDANQCTYLLAMHLAVGSLPLPATQQRNVMRPGLPVYFTLQGEAPEPLGSRYAIKYHGHHGYPIAALAAGMAK